jgi:hypothetical protein
MIGSAVYDVDLAYGLLVARQLMGAHPSGCLPLAVTHSDPPGKRACTPSLPNGRRYGYGSLSCRALRCPG